MASAAASGAFDSAQAGDAGKHNRQPQRGPKNVIFFLLADMAACPKETKAAGGLGSIAEQ
ncbi:hypothetical protein ABZX12_07975 [Kribbella sp. NPDC003505]|uniref:hypothetical protein n=1 Tax=Kribbella sp. NPDC003505 TaxID=3154448 RepID=UPI0033A5861D